MTDVLALNSTEQIGCSATSKGRYEMTSIRQLHPEVTPWVEGKTHRAGAWTATDNVVREDGWMTRTIWHYATAMLEFEGNGLADEWKVYPCSIGHGSVSDQQGCNQLLKGSGWYFQRQGGARYVNQNMRTEVTSWN